MLTVVLIAIRKDNIHEVPMLMAQRFPIFASGMLLADERLKLSMRLGYLWLILSVAFLFYLFYQNIDYLIYPCYFVLTFPLLIFLIRFFSFIPSILLKLLRFSGELSLELYLIHMILIPVLLRYMQNYNRYYILILIYIISFLAAIVVEKSVKKGIRLCRLK